ncbi:VC0807 family protein [Microbacterium sp. ARD31]|uniref:VC0807 family protein n=1 Tax=Microbacterium sp. ARD31 TaxID=2962576 RepID=UPI002882BD01|nr:VC0807 family protein [Microbacterium sp. ARD31]MDT0185312.1 VC0807 family protein [Microbacterium sp. ARD31]
MTLLRPLLGIVGSTALYYLMRHFGVSVYAALVVGAVVSLVPACVSLLRGSRPSGLEAFFTVLLFASFAIALLPGDERFLLAKDSLVTGGIGFWFLASLWWADRPLAYQFAKPMVEGRLGWVGDWERRWREDETFRRMWRTSSTLWAAGTLLDAVARVVMAYTLPADVVPGLNLAMYVATAVVLNVVTTVVYVRAGAIRGRRRARVTSRA